MVTPLKKMADQEMRFLVNVTLDWVVLSLYLRFFHGQYDIASMDGKQTGQARLRSIMEDNFASGWSGTQTAFSRSNITTIFLRSIESCILVVLTGYNEIMFGRHIAVAWNRKI